MNKTSAMLVAGLLLSSCATTEEQFYANYSEQTVGSLCRALQQTQNPAFRADLLSEISRRGRTENDCRKRVATENAAIVGLALVGTAVAIGVAANNGAFDGYGGGGGSYAPARPYGVAWDQFYDRYGMLTWRCRDKSSGEFTYDTNCGYLAKSDHTWPAKYV